jgi:hypothetical protein
MVQVFADPNQQWAWTAVAFPNRGYAWLSLKDPRILASTIFWFSNGGRHYAPWSSRHVNVAGIEEVTSFFNDGLAASAGDNPMTERGLKTTLQLQADRPTHVNYIMAAVPIPETFDEVATIEPTDAGLRLHAQSGVTASTAIDLDWLTTE